MVTSTSTSTHAGRRGSTGLGTALVVGGSLALVHQIDGLGPQFGALALIAAGVAFFVGMFLGNAGALAIPGSVLTTIGLILGYQNLTGDYASSSFAWTLVVAAIGLGLLLKGFWNTEPKTFAAGKRVAVIGLVLFGVTGTLAVADLHAASVGSWLLPVLLVGLGVYLSRSKRG